MKSKFRPGDRVVTSAAYARATNFKNPIEGFLIKQTGWQADVWLVMMNGFEVPQRVHASMLVKMERAKMDKSRVVKMAGHDWVKLEGDKFTWCADTGDRVPSRIRQLDAATFCVYRAGRYLGCEGTLSLAAERAKLNVRSEVNREMDWQREHPDEQPLGLRLTTEERAALWPERPSAGGRVPPPPAKALRGSSGPARGQEPGGAGRVSMTMEPAGPGKVRVTARVKPDGNRDAEVAALLKRGCTSEEVLRVTGWKAVSMPAMAKKLGLALRIEKGAKPFKYYGEVKK